jgi:GMP synthase PP-ATPase subunit
MLREEYEPVIAEWVEEVLKRGVSLTKSPLSERLTMVEDVLKRGVSSTLQSKIAYQNQVGEVLKCNVSSTFGSKTANILGVKEVLKREVYSTQCNVGLQGSRPVEEVLESKAPPTTVDNLSAVVTMEKVLSLKAGVRECKMKMKKILNLFKN